MTGKIGGLCLSLVVGAALVWGADAALAHAGRSRLLVTIDPFPGKNGLVLNATLRNAGGEIRTLPLAALDIFTKTSARDPANVRMYFRAPTAEGKTGTDAGEQPGHLILIRQGETLSLGEISTVFKSLPPGAVTLSVVYEVPAEAADNHGGWRGFVESDPVTIEVTRN